MKDLLQSSGEVSITLKEITDLLEVRHDKSKLKVDQLLKEPSFGIVSKTDIINLNGLKVETYLLNKKQAIIVGAKLNNALLIKLVNKLEEIENNKKPSLPSVKELALMVIKSEEEKELLQIENKKKSTFISNVIHSQNSYTATQVAKDFNISAKLFNKILLEAGVIYYQNGSYALTSRYQSFNLTTIKETTPDSNDKTYLSLRWTVAGKNWLKNNWEKALQRCTSDTFDEYNMQFLKNLPTIAMPKKSERNF